MSWAYAAYGRCGCCITAVCAEDPDDPKWTARTVAGYIRAGWRVERVTDEQVRSASFVRPGGGCRWKAPEPPVPTHVQGDLFEVTP